jgi:hypothetical protein
LIACNAAEGWGCGRGWGRGWGWRHPQANRAWKMPSTISNTFRTVNLLSVVEMLTKNNQLQNNL